MGGIGNGRVRQEIQRESLAGVVDVYDQRTRGPHQRCSHALFRIAVAAVFDGVHEQFAECRAHVLADSRRQVAFDFAHELGGPLDGIHLAVDVQCDPLGPRRNQADVVLPLRRAESLLHHVGQRPGGRRSAEVAVSAMANGADDARRVGIAGQNHACLGSHGTHAAEQFQRVETVAAGAGEQHVEGRLAQALQRRFLIGDVLDATAVGCERTCQQFVDGGVRVDHQQALRAHRVSISLL
jgi:hypothetical protein